MVALEKDYIVRKIDPSTPRRVPQRRPPKRRRRPGLPLWLIAALIVVAAVAIVLVVVFTRGKGEDDTGGDVSSSDSQASSLPGEVFSQAPESTASVPETVPDFAMPDQEHPDAEPDTFDSMVVVDGTGYGLYKFSEEDTNSYIRLVCDAEEALPDSATLYSMVVPTALDVLLEESYITEHEIDSSDQRKAVEDYIYPSIWNLNGEVKTVSLFDPLRSRCDEYIYYRSDPSWTQLGAYYAYVEFCAAAGLEAVPLEDFELKSYEGYLGSYYHSSGDSTMGSYPDTVEAYFSSADTELSYTTQDGNTESGTAVIQDGEGYNPDWLNLIFIAGDQPYAEITNNDLDDGSACIVVKESLGNVFVPFLASHYQYVYVIDYRTYSGSVPDLARETGASAVILLNGIRMTSDEGLISDLGSVF